MQAFTPTDEQLRLKQRAAAFARDYDLSSLRSLFCAGERLDPATYRWAADTLLADRAGLRACWSTPIFSHQNNVIGSFAMYYRAPRTPTLGEVDLIEIAERMPDIVIRSLEPCA